MRNAERINPIEHHLPIFPRLMVRYLSRAGFHEEEIFRRLDFSAEDLAIEDFRLTSVQHEHFIKRAVELTGNRHLALDMKEDACDATANAMLLLFATSGRISKALKLITRYIPIYTRTLSSSMVESETEPLLVVDSHIDEETVSYFALSSFVLFIDTFFRQPLNGAHLVTQARLSLPKPDDFDLVSHRFGFEITFDYPRTEIHLAPELIDTPIKTADPQTTRLITEFCEKQLAYSSSGISAGKAVSNLLIDKISKPPTLSEAAATIGLSARSLRRYLQNERTTYQTLLNEARRVLSIKLLLDTNEPVSTIAHRMGFKHPSHFGRAFKNWTGESPSEYRLKHR